MEHVRQTLPYARWVAAGVLLASAAAKLLVPAESVEGFAAVVVQSVGPPTEAALAGWLLSGVKARAATWVAGSVFLAFAAYAAWRLVRPSAPCGCFGRLAVDPLLALAMTATGAAALLSAAVRVRRVAAVGLTSAFALASSGTGAYAVASLVGGETPIDTSSSPDLVGHLRATVGERLDGGEWRIWVVQHDCSHCRSVLLGSVLASSVRLLPKGHVLIAEVPPYASEVQRRVLFPAEVASVRLPADYFPPCLPAAVTVTGGNVSRIECVH